MKLFTVKHLSQKLYVLSAIFFLSFLKIWLTAVLFPGGNDPPREPAKISIAKGKESL